LSYGQNGKTDQKDDQDNRQLEQGAFYPSSRSVYGIGLTKDTPYTTTA
jgi:hypothetical protein